MMTMMQITDEQTMRTVAGGGRRKISQRKSLGGLSSGAGKLRSFLGDVAGLVVGIQGVDDWYGGMLTGSQLTDVRIWRAS